MNKNKNHNKIVDRLSTKLTTHKKIMAAYPKLIDFTVARRKQTIT
jgi:hypothetical protein